MLQRFELFVAFRYLTARRKQTVISVVTLISVAGVTAGVMALVIAMAITNGFRTALQEQLTGATAHVMVLEKEISTGIVNWRQLVEQLSALPGVRQTAPSLYDGVMFNGIASSTGGVLKGILPPDRSPRPDALRRLTAGEFKNWDTYRGYPPMILGVHLAKQLGLNVGDIVRIVSRNGDLTPMGPKFIQHEFRVSAIFESGFYELDNSWAFTSMTAVQHVLGVGDVANAVELTLSDPDQADAIAAQAEKLVGPKLAATHWKEQHRRLLNALRGERLVAGITIGLIQLVATLNILTSLTMMVMEKYRDVALLMSMGARHNTIFRIFVAQGALIGTTGTFLGLFLGHLLCWLGEYFRVLQLDEAVYSLSYVPLTPRLIDSLWIAAVAIAISLLATVLPARNAARIAPAEALRHGG